MIVALAATLLLSDGCLEFVDEAYIRSAEEIFVGVPTGSEEGTIDILVVSSLRSTHFSDTFGSTVSLPGSTNSEIGWREVSALVEHRDTGYLDSEAYYPGVVVEAWDESCSASYSLTSGVRYLFVLGSEARLRSVEPVTSAGTDPWFRHVLSVIESTE